MIAATLRRPRARLPGMLPGSRAMSANTYWYTGKPAIPIQLPKVLGIADPSDFRVGENATD